MRNRGPCFWRWSDVQLPPRVHEEQLPDGTQIEVQARLSRTGGTQMFVGVYLQDGRLLAEETYDTLPSETLSRALLTGTHIARKIAANSAVPLSLVNGD